MQTPARLFLAAHITAATTFISGCGHKDPVLELNVTPPEASVIVDGYIHPGTSPHKIEFKNPGKYRLVVSADGYKPVEMLITMESGDRKEQMVELIPDNLKIAIPFDPRTDPMPNTPAYPDTPTPMLPGDIFQLSVSTTPSGASVYVRDPRSPKRSFTGYSPVTVDLSVTGATEVTLVKPGYNEEKRLVVAPRDGYNAVLDVQLERYKNPTNPIYPTDPIMPIQPPVDQLDRSGFISVNSNPWTAVHIDGKPMGNTPLVSVKVSSGIHEVLMENRDEGVRRKRTVNVRPGEHVRIVEDLR